MQTGIDVAPSALDAVRSSEWHFDYLFSLGASSWLVHLCVTLLGGVVLHVSEAGSWVAYWTAAMSALSLAMMALAVAYRRRSLPGSPSSYGAVHSILTGFAGMGWGSGALLCAATSSTEMLTFFTLVLGGTALGAISSQHVLMRSCMISIWTSVPLLAAAWLLHGSGGASIPTAMMMLLFGVVLTVLAKRMNTFMAQNVALARELAEKNGQLSRSAAKLAEVHEEKSRFLAQASHDLRQPIHAIGLFVAYLSSIKMGRDGREVLANIERSLESLNRLCRSLLDLSALDVGRVKPDIGRVSLADVLGEVVRQAGEAARAAGVSIRYRSSRLWVESDPALLHMMIQNLVSNALKYAPGAQMLIGVRRRRGRLAIVVMDTGPGIALADQERVFHEFVQIERPG